MSYIYIYISEQGILGGKFFGFYGGRPIGSGMKNTKGSLKSRKHKKNMENSVQHIMEHKEVHPPKVEKNTGNTSQKRQIKVVQA